MFPLKHPSAMFPQTRRQCVRKKDHYCLQLFKARSCILYMQKGLHNGIRPLAVIKDYITFAINFAKAAIKEL